uniref:Putative ovule protein n=1 Tax=Solanum chacoense TaxID=4108 RepID=A0A0V0I101_SOLCH
MLNRIHLDDFQTSTKIEALVSNYFSINKYVLSRLYMLFYFIVFLSQRVQEAAILHHFLRLPYHLTYQA